MRKFSKSFRGYNKKEVNDFVEEVVSKVEVMVSELNKKDAIIADLTRDLARYKSMEETLNKSIIMAEETSQQMRKLARIESENIINDAKKNANKIVDDALTKSSKIETESLLLKKNVQIFKTRLKSIIEQQLQMVDEMDEIKL